MALAVYQQPADYQPIHTPCMLEAVSTNTANTDFKYKVVMTITGVALPRTLYISPRPVDSRLEVDLGTHLRDYLDYDGFTLPFSATFETAPYVEYVVSIQENWGGVDQGSPMVLTTKTVSNVLIDRQEWLQNIATTFNRFHIKEDGTMIPGQPIPQILLNKPLGAPMFKDELYYLHVVGRTDFDAMRLRVLQYNAAGGVVGSIDTVAPLSLTAKRAVFAKVDLSTITFSALCKRIGLVIVDGLNSETTDIGLFDVADYDCTPWERWKLFFMDKYGSYNNVSLDMISSSEFEVSAKTFRRRINPLTDSSRQRAVTRYTQSTDKKFTLNTDLLNEAKAKVIEDLIQSPRVYRDVRNVDGWGNSDFLPVEITTAKLKPYAPGANDMPQYAIEMKYAFENNARHE